MALAGFGLLIAAVAAEESEMFVLGPLYLVYAAAYLACAHYLGLYGRKIGAFQQTDRVDDLEDALVAQKSFWKLVGVLMAIVLAVVVVMMAVLLVAMAVGARF
jgi:hypothetical protein